MVKIIFSDVDGTLVHSDATSDEFVLVKVPNEEKYISQSAIDAIRAIIEAGHKFAIITGRRQSTFERIASIVPHHYGIIEHGCVVLKGSSYDPDWATLLEPTVGKLGEKVGPIWEYESRLLAEGYKTDSTGRFATFRVFIDKPGNMTESQKQFFEGKVAAEGAHLGLTTTRNVGMLDVLPICGGKANAIRFLIQSEHLKANDVIAFGDDVNDFDMLGSVATVACPGNANAEIQSLVRARGGYVSHLSQHAGTLDMLVRGREHVMTVE